MIFYGLCHLNNIKIITKLGSKLLVSKYIDYKQITIFSRVSIVIHTSRPGVILPGVMPGLALSGLLNGFLSSSL